MSFIRQTSQETSFKLNLNGIIYNGYYDVWSDDITVVNPSDYLVKLVRFDSNWNLSRDYQQYINPKGDKILPAGVSWRCFRQDGSWTDIHIFKKSHNVTRKTHELFWSGKHSLDGSQPEPSKKRARGTTNGKYELKAVRNNASIEGTDSLIVHKRVVTGTSKTTVLFTPTDPIMDLGRGCEFTFRVDSSTPNPSRIQRTETYSLHHMKEITCQTGPTRTLRGQHSAYGLVTIKVLVPNLAYLTV